MKKINKQRSEAFKNEEKKSEPRCEEIFCAHVQFTECVKLCVTIAWCDTIYVYCAHIYMYVIIAAIYIVRSGSARVLQQ